MVVKVLVKPVTKDILTRWWKDTDKKAKLSAAKGRRKDWLSVLIQDYEKAKLSAAYL